MKANHSQCSNGSPKRCICRFSYGWCRCRLRTETMHNAPLRWLFGSCFTFSPLCWSRNLILEVQSCLTSVPRVLCYWTDFAVPTSAGGWSRMTGNALFRHSATLIVLVGLLSVHAVARAYRPGDQVFVVS